MKNEPIFGCEVIARSMEDEESLNMWVRSLIN